MKPGYRPGAETLIGSNSNIHSLTCRQMPPILNASLGERDVTQPGDHSKQATAIKGIYGKITVLQTGAPNEDIVQNHLT